MIKLFLKFPLGTFLTATLYMAAASLGEIHVDSMSEDSMTEYLDEKNPHYSLPAILKLAKELDFKQSGYKSNIPNPKTERFWRFLSSNSALNHYAKKRMTDSIKKRKFPEVDSRGFDSDIFDEGFGDWSPMKRW
ncbi:uncharacterized protein [Parasteatoda tepidariorum]|uniref:uncharacterized protein isoform X1 n=1 Tax=Parasteatoda tepidariorum TaxID=114398 RepID=UPI00077FC67D|nr:uncharacterized protein LOC107450130 isoform X1 [Parasteatoda tepidariorum]